MTSPIYSSYSEVLWLKAENDTNQKEEVWESKTRRWNIAENFEA